MTPLHSGRDLDGMSRKVLIIECRELEAENAALRAKVEHLELMIDDDAAARQS